MANLTLQSVLNEVKKYNSYYNKNRSEKHITAFANAIYESVEDWGISNPNLYLMYLVCETIIPATSNRSLDNMTRYCKDELLKDIHYWSHSNN